MGRPRGEVTTTPTDALVHRRGLNISPPADEDEDEDEDEVEEEDEEEDEDEDEEDEDWPPAAANETWCNTPATRNRPLSPQSASERILARTPRCAAAVACEVNLATWPVGSLITTALPRCLPVPPSTETQWIGTTTRRRPDAPATESNGECTGGR